MLNKIKHYLLTNRGLVLRMTFAVVFISRGIMQLFPWYVIHGRTRDFVVNGDSLDMAYCALGLAILFIQWRPTFLRIATVCTLASTVTLLIYYFSHLFWEDRVYFTMPYWIFSTITIIAWCSGNGLVLDIIQKKVREHMKKEGDIKTTKAGKRKKRRKKRKKG